MRVLRVRNVRREERVRVRREGLRKVFRRWGRKGVEECKGLVEFFEDVEEEEEGEEGEVSRYQIREVA